MQIKLTNVGVPYKDGKLDKVELHYERDGKPTKRVLVSMGKTKDVFAKLITAKAGEHYEIELTKDGDFYNWTGIKAVLDGYPEAAGTAPAKSAPVAKSTYETSEERAIRQRLIVRQSAIAQAIASIPVGGNKDFFKGAEEIFDFVFEQGKFAKEKELKNDIPY